MTDPYEDQLAAARYRAERDQARQELARLKDRSRDTTVSAYDLLPEDDREALRWVREHGGIGAVATMADKLGDTLRWIRERAGVGDDEVVDYDELLDALDRRLMPEGMEWPRFDDGEPVRIGDVVSDIEVRSVVIREDGIILSDCTSVPGWGTWRSYKEPIKRPAAPAADGEPLEVGQTVLDVESGTEYKVVGIHTDEDSPVRVMRTDGSHLAKTTRPSQLTHERPVADTWERLEEDAEKDPCGYFGFDEEETCGKCPASGKNCKQTMARDLVRRCRALAERERSE